jgi:hypothetical protein
MCQHGNTKPLVVIGNDGKAKFADIDSCIYKLVKVLNDSGFRTKACCCGHGKTNGNIALMDGRELIIAKDWNEARKIESGLHK